MSSSDTSALAMLFGIGATIYFIVGVWKEASWNDEYLKALASTVFIAPFVYLIASLVALAVLGVLF